MGCLRFWHPCQETFVTIAFFALCIVRQEYSEGPGQYGLTLSAFFTDRGTDGRASEFSLRLFGLSGHAVASDPGNAEFRNR